MYVPHRLTEKKLVSAFLAAFRESRYHTIKGVITHFTSVWEHKDGKKEKEVKKEREPSQSTVKEEVEKPSSKKENGTTKGE